MNWDEIKIWVESQNIHTLRNYIKEKPDDIKSYPNGGMHEAGKDNRHDMDAYVLTLKANKRFDLSFYWSWCSDCKKVWSEKLVALDNDENAAYMREFTKHGDTTGY